MNNNGHYLFLKAHSFPRASRWENCSLLGRNNVREEIFEIIFASNGGHRIVYLKSLKFSNINMEEVMYHKRIKCLSTFQNIHREKRTKHNSLLNVWKCGETLYFVVDILRQSKKSSMKFYNRKTTKILILIA